MSPTFAAVRFHPLLAWALFVFSALTLRADTAQITALSPEPTQRNGSIRRAQITPDDNHVVFIETGPQYGSGQLFHTALLPPGSAPATPIRIDRSQPESPGVSDFTLLGNGSTVLYISAEIPSSGSELFAYELTTGLRRRLSLPPPAGVTQGLERLSTSPTGNWVIYLARQSNAHSSVAEHYVAPTDGSSLARRLPHAVLPGNVYIKNETSLILLDETSGAGPRLLNFDLASGQVTQIDALSLEDAETYRSGSYDPGTGLIALKVSANSNLTSRFRVVDSSGIRDARWIAETNQRDAFGAFFMGPSVFSVLGREVGSNVYTRREHNLATGMVSPWIGPAFAGMGIQYIQGQYILSLPGQDRKRGLLFYTVGDINPDLRYLRVHDGQDVGLRELCTAVGLTDAQGHIRVIADETGRAHGFFISRNGTWWFDLDPDEAASPVRIAPFETSGIEVVHAASNLIVLYSLPEDADPLVRNVYRAALTGGEPRLLGRHRYGEDPSPFSYGGRGTPFTLRVRVTSTGGRVVFSHPDTGLVTADLGESEFPARLVSPPFPLVGTAGVSSAGAHALIETSRSGRYLASLATGQLQRLDSPEFPALGSFFSPDGRWVFIHQPAPLFWSAVDTTGEFGSRSLGATFNERLLAVGNDHKVIQVRGGNHTENLSLYLTDLRTGDILELGTLPRSAATRIDTLDGVLSADGRTLALQTWDVTNVREFWLVPLQGGAPAALQLPSGINQSFYVVRLDATHVYLNTYEGVVYAVARDGSDHMRLSEAAPPPPRWARITGATDVQIDLVRRIVVYTSDFPDGVRRLHRRSLDSPDQLGFPGEVFELEGKRAVLRGGAILCHHLNDIWWIGATPGAAPKRLTASSASGYAPEAKFSSDGRFAFIATNRLQGFAIHRHELATGAAARLTPPTHDSPYGQFIIGNDDREVWFSAAWESPWTYRIYRARLPDADAPAEPDGLEHSGYAAWVVAADLPAGLEAATEDADGDGVANLLEYLHGSDARDAAARPKFSLTLQTGSVSGNLTTDGWELAYTAHDLRRAGRAWPQVSSDLVTWFDVPGRTPLDFDATTPAEYCWPVGRIFDSRIFYRLRFELAE